jgi:phage terminase small subunit
MPPPTLNEGGAMATAINPSSKPAAFDVAVRPSLRAKATPLSPKRAAFCAAYALGASVGSDRKAVTRFDGKAAAIAAGYSPRSAKNAAYRLLDYPHVQREIQRLIDRTAAKQELDADEVLRRLDTVYSRCMQAEPVIEDGSETGEYVFNASGAIRSCELIGRYLRMWQAEGSINVHVTIQQARDFACGFARRILVAIEEHVSDPDERKRLIGILRAEALRDE